MSAPAWANAHATQYKAARRIVLLECPHCGKRWDVAKRGRETGFIVAAANNHTTGCAQLIANGETVEHRR